MSEAPQNPKPREPKRRRFRFGLKALLVFTALVAVLLGITTNRANRQRRAVEAISKIGGQLAYRYQKASGSPQATGFRFTLEAEPPGPDWLWTIFGDYFVTPVGLSIADQALLDQGRLAYLCDLPEIETLSVHAVRLSAGDLAHFRHLANLRSARFERGTLSAVDGPGGFEFLSQWPDLEELSLSDPSFGDEAAAYLDGSASARRLYLYDTAIGDEGLAHLRGMSQLEVLGLARTQVGDAGLAHLKALTSLTYLCLNGTQVTDAGLEHLKALGNLQTVELFGTKVTPQGLADFKAAMPHCRVVP